MQRARCRAAKLSTWVYVDETKRAGYVMAAVAVADPGATRKVIRGLVQPGNRRLHMVDERPRARPGIVASLIATSIEATIYDAGRQYRTDRQARSACLCALVEDLAGPDVRIVFEQDETLLSHDNQTLIEATRATGQREHLHYEHLHAHEEPLLALPDVVAWCWVRSGEWRRRIDPILASVRRV